jgi:hypothetical protein
LGEVKDFLYLSTVFPGPPVVYAAFFTRFRGISGFFRGGLVFLYERPRGIFVLSFNSSVFLMEKCKFILCPGFFYAAARDFSAALPMNMKKSRRRPRVPADCWR